MTYNKPDSHKMYLVTGAARFIGFYLSRSLLEKGCRIIGIDNMNGYYDIRFKEKRLELLSDYDGFTFLKVDISDKKALAEVFGKYQPAIVVNLTAQVGRRYIQHYKVMVAEVTAFYKEKGMSIYDGLLSLYDQFGYFQESIQSLTLKGKEGAALIEAMMNEFRQHVPAEIAGVKVVAVEDYQASERYDLMAKEKMKLVLPKSNVLKFYCENGSWFCLRPSGTEPKMKFYFAVRGQSQAESQHLLQQLETDVMSRVNELVK